MGASDRCSAEKLQSRRPSGQSQRERFKVAREARRLNADVYSNALITSVSF